MCAPALHVCSRVHTQAGHAQGRGSGYSAPCIWLLSHLGKLTCVCVCVSLLSSAGWSGPWLSVHSVLVADRDTQDRAGVCPLSCPHPHRVVTIPRGCWCCCQHCLCPHRALQPPQLSPPLPARCRLASMAEMVRAQLRGWEQPGPAAITPGQCWAVTQDMLTMAKGQPCVCALALLLGSVVAVATLVSPCWGRRTQLQLHLSQNKALFLLYSTLGSQ